jgi:hypothetical protein
VKTILHQLLREIEHQADSEKPTDNDQDVEHQILVRQAINISLILLTFQRACPEKEGRRGKHRCVYTNLNCTPANEMHKISALCVSGATKRRNGPCDCRFWGGQRRRLACVEHSMSHLSSPGFW